MTRLMIDIEEGHEDELQKLLHTAAFKAELVGEVPATLLAEPETQYQKLKKILDKAKGKDLFKEIEDPSEWQRQIRKEWDRDYKLS